MLLSPALLPVQLCGRVNTGSETFGVIQGKRKGMRSQTSSEGSSWEPGRRELLPLLPTATQDWPRFVAVLQGIKFWLPSEEGYLHTGLMNISIPESGSTNISLNKNVLGPSKLLLSPGKVSLRGTSTSTSLLFACFAAG